MQPAPEPRVLIVETSGRVGQVAVARGDQVLTARRLDEARRHARDLAPAVADLLAAQAWRPRDLDVVIVSRGPGSYTGLRVGIMSVKALAYATGCALVAVDTFAAIALQAPGQAMTIDVVADAQQDKVYLQQFARPAPGNLPGAASTLAIEPFSAWLGGRSTAAWITGPGLRGHETRLPTDAHIVDPADWDPRPESLLRLGLIRYRSGERDSVWTLEPLYLRPSSAEEKWASQT
jgi:tRNA threonylcarbamoyladenosine biosynthesis protein TsaB